ncbi:ubiquitin carboxyl-terminal hydrolase 37-like [Boleophthalmus pectinirostris]|uniref:ubiquitin carboxyl-terminal hydrolase 37-like n=1 Tax=Boleophthalmus pectinirostris TaxID=150288 RepID=UPI00242D7D4A|nr:ubiquitin carboxyl-terminal hydrolase 37-like [Boleophthalmus pectinirostris]
MAELPPEETGIVSKEKPVTQEKTTPTVNILSKGEPMSQVATIPSKKGLDLARSGLPNIGNSCYMNACIQALRTIKPFMSMLSVQENVWANCDEAELLRQLKTLADVPYSSEHVHMTALAWSFKVAVAQQAPIFGDFQQQDAHELLMSLMEQIQSFAPILDVFAFSLETSYVCPVKEHMRFQMETTRTCKSYGQMYSGIIPVLSLDLSSGRSIRKLLAHHLRELEYRCECGSTLSGQTACIATLPNVLILHLKRFSYDSQFRMEKVMHRIQLDEDLVIQSKQKAGCFKLVSIISHLEYSADHGHYICDGLGPDNSPLQPKETWLTYDDLHVTKTSAQDIC